MALCLLWPAEYGRSGSSDPRDLVSFYCLSDLYHHENKLGLPCWKRREHVKENWLFLFKVMVDHPKGSQTQNMWLWHPDEQSYQPSPHLTADPFRSSSESRGTTQIPCSFASNNINGYCFKSRRFGMLCCTVIANWPFLPSVSHCGQRITVQFYK